MIHPAIFDTSQLLALKGVQHAVLSPGSRNSPLLISFARNNHITSYNVVDERSAGFIALGIAQQTQRPVVLCCTSGTALLNYAPAIAEAYHQEVPLIVLSADRPPEWVGQRDGQTIQQPGALANFVKATYDLPVVQGEAEAQHYHSSLNDALNKASQSPRGPVHINIPFREPFYPANGQVLRFSDTPNVKAYEQPVYACPSHLMERLQPFRRILLVPGQQPVNDRLAQVLQRIKDHVVIVSDVISNIHVEGAVRHQDLFLGQLSPEACVPLCADLLITWGKSLISKNLKLFLRKYTAREHWHLDEGAVPADPLQSITRLIQCPALTFFEEMESSLCTMPPAGAYAQGWQHLDRQAKQALHLSLDAHPESEYALFREVLRTIPTDTDVHLANSTPVRYANFLQDLAPGCEVFANRGTSGIDGCNSTALGHALSTDRLTVLLTGDLSFFYDRNGFFGVPLPAHLRIVVFNNRGGGIFRLIPGPSGQPELEQHFATSHQHSASHTASEYGFEYQATFGHSELLTTLKTFFVSGGLKPGLLEVFTEPTDNVTAFQQVKEAMKQALS